MITRNIACLPFKVKFQSIPMPFRKKDIIPTAGLKRKYHKTAAATGATARLHVRFDLHRVDPFCFSKSFRFRVISPP